MTELSVESVLDAIEDGRSDVASFELLRAQIGSRAKRLSEWAARTGVVRLDRHAAEGRRQIEELDILARAYQRFLHEPVTLAEAS